MRLRTSNCLLPLALIAAGWSSPAAEPDTSGRETDRALSHAVWADGFRKSAMAEPVDLPDKGVFFPDAAIDWRRMIPGPGNAPADGTFFLRDQIADFFGGATVLPGPYNANGAVFAYWNPFWDALLFVRTKRSSVDEPAKIDKFVWSSGETFRGETLADGAERVRTVVPVDERAFSSGLWKIQAETVARFRERYSEGGKGTVVFDDGIKKTKLADEWTAIQSRAALRLKTASMLLRDPTNAAVAARCCALLRSAGESELVRNFDSRPHRFFCRTLAKLPSPIRAGFEPYGFVPGPEGSLFLFVNADVPRLYATVSFPKDRLSGPFAGAVQMEWYDLDRADELLAALGGDKGEGKEDAR